MSRGRHSLPGGGGLFLFFSGTFLGMRYVVVLSCEIESLQELDETLRVVRAAPHLEEVHLAIRDSADAVMAALNLEKS